MRAKGRFATSWLGLSVLGLILTTGSVVWAAGPSPAKTPAKAKAEGHVAPVNGVMITWDKENHKFLAPTAEQARQIAKQFTAMMEARMAGGHGVLAPKGQLKVETLPSGAKRVRLTADHLNAEMAVFDKDGHLVQSCAEGPALAAKVLEMRPSGHLEEQ